MKILMVSAENGALPGGKAGGMGDVIREVPPALCLRGHQVDVIMPSYGVFHRQESARFVAEVRSEFRGHGNTVSLFKFDDLPAGSGVRCWVLEHPNFSSAGKGVLYCDDPPERPFASDASKFALFCRAVCDALLSRQLDDYDVLHLHDWHAAMALILIQSDPRYAPLARLRTVFTIHNLSLQGIRPFADDDSSLQAWFPALNFDTKVMADPRYSGCLNPVRAAIQLSDKVHVVSPSYVGEIQQPTVPERGFIGGEGLEHDLCEASDEGRLIGILNGCEYHKQPAKRKVKPKGLIADFESSVLQWMSRQPTADSSYVIALRRLDEWSRMRSNPRVFLTSVGRLTAQKLALLRAELEPGLSALDGLLTRLAERDGAMVVLGSGDKAYEAFFTQVMARHSHFIFLKGFSEDLSDQLYRNGDLFLMPSSFEPCGISQMLAMRAGQPCLVHGVGGLKDTVIQGEQGFVFQGASPYEQARNLLTKVDEALEVFFDQPAKWKTIAEKAGAQRFLWSDSVEHYERELYQ